MVSFEEFKRLEIKVAKVKEVRDHPNADKLYVMIVDVGGKEKQIVAGIKNHYRKEELVGHQIVLVDNLEPTTIRGIESQGMLLAAQDENRIVILIPEKKVKTGSQVR